MKAKYYIIASWAYSHFLSDNLNFKRIPFALYVISGVNTRIEIDAEYLNDARTICDGWKEDDDE